MEKLTEIGRSMHPLAHILILIVALHLQVELTACWDLFGASNVMRHLEATNGKRRARAPSPFHSSFRIPRPFSTLTLLRHKDMALSRSRSGDSSMQLDCESQP